jgi:biotin transport system substrate-specific component
MTSTALAPTLARTPSAVREVGLVVGGVTLLSLAAQVVVPLPFTPVPITGQTFAALLVGGAYGLGRATTTLLAYLAIGVIGIPVFADGASGLAAIASASGGYLVGMVLASSLVGVAADRGWDRRLGSSLLAMLVGSVVIYLVGATWLAVDLNLGATSAYHLGVRPFLVGDLIKLALAGALLPGAWGIVDRYSAGSR